MKIPNSLHFLIVDDAITAQIMIQNTLIDYGVTKENISTAPNVNQAWNIINQRKSSSEYQISVVICDWHMPGETGLELLKKVRSVKSLQNIPFILVTTENQKSAVIQAIEAKVTDYLIKPWTEKELLSKIETAWLNYKKIRS